MKLELKVLIISLIICILVFVVIPVSFGDSNTCGDTKDAQHDWSYGATIDRTVCHLNFISHQNDKLIQLQEQENKLLAYNYCKGETHLAIRVLEPIDKVGNTTILGFNGKYAVPFDDCVSQVLNDTQ